MNGTNSSQAQSFQNKEKIYLYGTEAETAAWEINDGFGNYGPLEWTLVECATSEQTCWEGTVVLDLAADPTANFFAYNNNSYSPANNEISIAYTSLTVEDELAVFLRSIYGGTPVVTIRDSGGSVDIQVSGLTRINTTIPNLISMTFVTEVTAGAGDTFDEPILTEVPC